MRLKTHYKTPSYNNDAGYKYTSSHSSTKTTKKKTDRTRQLMLYYQ